ncbi:MAG: dTDP-glucose 4,6-dehydratase [Candidatus Binatia bacterium]
MILLVTGGAGFIGSHFIRLVLEKHPSWRVINLDKLTYSGNLENLRDVEEGEQGKRYFFIEGDICDATLVAALFSGGHRLFKQHADLKPAESDRCPIGAVAHFAAESHVDRSIRDASAFFATNVEGTRILLENARRYWRVERSATIRTPYRFVHVSTDEVYGALGPHDPPFTEEGALRPNSPYAASKAAADLAVLAYHHTYGLPAIITRCVNNYGPYQHPEKFIPLFITNALEERPLPLYGDGRQVRDWIYVTDHCKALLLILENGKVGEVYNIGACEEHANLEVAELITQCMGRSRDLIRGVADRPGHDRRYALDVIKIESGLGWRAEQSFIEGMRYTIRWYQDHSPWWKRLKNDSFWKYYQEVYGSI